MIIFDEIQFCSDALTSLKYFCETANAYHIVCAGSLLGTALARPTSYPVGKVDILTLRPMSTNIRSKSMQVYRGKYSPPLVVKATLLNLYLNEGMLNIPLYLLWKLPAFMMPELFGN